MYFNIILFILLSFSSQEKPNRVLVIGDSITKDGRYITQLKNTWQCEIDSYGFVGYGSTQIRHEFEKLDLKKYKMVIIQMGINNIYDVKSIKTDFEVMIYQAHKQHLQIVLLTIPPFRGYPSWTKQNQENLMKVNNWILTRPFSVQYAINIYSPLQSDGRSKHSTDRLHPDAKGHEIIADKILSQVPF